MSKKAEKHLENSDCKTTMNYSEEDALDHSVYYRLEDVVKAMQSYAESYLKEQMNEITDKMQEDVNYIKNNDSWTTQFKDGFENCHNDYKILIKTALKQ